MAALPQIISSIVNALVSNIPAIVSCGVQLLTALIQNLPTIIATIITAVPEIIAGIVGAFGSLAGEVVNIGVNIAKGVWEGIKSMAGWLSDKVIGFFRGIIDGAKSILGIHSPSKVFAEIGEYTIKGFANGFEDGTADNRKRVLSAASALSDELTDALSTDATMQFQTELSGIYKKMQAAVDMESNKISSNAAAQAESKAASSGVTREVTNTNTTVEKVARIEGDGVTGELVRMLGLKLKDEDNRVGDSFKD